MHSRIKKKDDSTDEFEIPKAPKKPDRFLKIKLGKGKSAKYDVWQKEIPADAPSSVTIEGDSTPSPVTWFNNYGLKLRKDHANTTKDDPYEETVDHKYTVEVSAEAEKRFVIHTGGSNAKPMTVSGGKATLKLNAGDPLVGHSP
jgi:hypothetical protein